MKATPKEKAQKIFNHIKNVSFYIKPPEAKLISLFLVDEIIDAVDKSSDSQNFYWGDVREELEKS